MAVGPRARRRTREVSVRWGERVVRIGGGHPVVVQSMTNTDTADAIATALQVQATAEPCSEIARVTFHIPHTSGVADTLTNASPRQATTFPPMGYCCVDRC